MISREMSACLIHELYYAPLGVAVVDRQLRVQAVNSSLAAIHELPARAFPRRALNELLGGAAEVVAPLLERTPSSAIALTGIEVTCKLDNRAERGTWIANYIPVDDGKNKVWGVCAMISEVTREKRLEKLVLHPHADKGDRPLPFTGVAMSGAASRSANAESSRNSVQLTPAEVEIVRLIAEGKSSKEIGGVLSKSPKTIEWPGNVRELENTILRGLALRSGSVIEPWDLQYETGQFAAGAGEVDPVSMDEIERHAISKALEATSGNKPAAARMLGIGKSTLYRKLKEQPVGPKRTEIEPVRAAAAIAG